MHLVCISAAWIQFRHCARSVVCTVVRPTPAQLPGWRAGPAREYTLLSHTRYLSTYQTRRVFGGASFLNFRSAVTLVALVVLSSGKRKGNQHRAVRYVRDALDNGRAR